MEEGKIIKSSETIILRDAQKSDIEDYVRWMEEGEWKEYDAPWEKRITDLPPEEIKVRFINLYLSEREEPRRRVIIATKYNKPIGWMNRYFKERYEDTWLIGIDICDDDRLNRGLGTEALRLWIDYLFTHSQIKYIGLKTYSFNKRMMRVAEKLGMDKREIESDFVKWKCKKLDRIFYSIERNRWQIQKD